MILNPSSGAGHAGRLWPQVRNHLIREGLRPELIRQDGLDGLGALARRAAERYTVVAAMGGDGTVREVARGLQGTGAVLGIIPAGTGNGTAFSLGIPQDPERACRVLARGRPWAIDLGETSVGLFLNVAGVGLDARITREYHEGRIPPALGGIPGYVLAALRSLADLHACSLTVTLDEDRRSLRGLLVVVANGSYYGKGIAISPGSHPADGHFEVCLVEEAAPLELAGLVTLFLAGRLAEHPLVHVHRARRVRVEGDESQLVHLDGDVLGTTPVDFRLLPGRLRVMVPGIPGN